MDFEKSPTLKEFTETFNQYVNDIGCMNNPEGYIASHKIIGEIYIQNVDPDNDSEYIITGIDFSSLGGCGCPSDIIIKIKKL